MNVQESLIDQLESGLASKDLSKRAEVLRQVTDLFVLGAGKFSDEQVDLFDDVMSRLVSAIEVAARASFGSRLARINNAPGKVVRLLAFDDEIEVAAPVLAHSLRLDEDTLVENARTKSQNHLLAISGRRVLTEPVTDVLVDRGDQRVVASTAGNRGAKFSASGVSTLIKKAQDNGALALCVWARPDIPRHDLMKLFAHASEIVRSRLEAADPRRASAIRNAVAAASDEIQATARAGSHEHKQADAQVRSLQSAEQLNEARLFEFASNRNFDKTAVALSVMCDLPIGMIERALASSQPEQLLVFAKGIELSWETTKALLILQAGRDGLPQERLNQCLTSFSRLQSKTAVAALQFYRLRERANKTPSAPS